MKNLFLTENKFYEEFEKYVPQEGIAETLGGEVLRAWTALCRNWNIYGRWRKKECGWAKPSEITFDPKVQAKLWRFLNKMVSIDLKDLEKCTTYEEFENKGSEQILNHIHKYNMYEIPNCCNCFECRFLDSYQDDIELAFMEEAIDVYEYLSKKGLLNEQNIAQRYSWILYTVKMKFKKLKSIDVESIVSESKFVKMVLDCSTQQSGEAA